MQRRMNFILKRIYIFCSRSSASTDSGLLLKSTSPDSLPPFLRRHHNKLKKQLATMSSNNATVHVCQPRQQQQHHHQQQQETLIMNRHFSLHSLLEALPAASVDTGALDSRVKRASLSSLSTNSRTSDFDGFFYIWKEKKNFKMALLYDSNFNWRMNKIKFFFFWPSQTTTAFRRRKKPTIFIVYVVCHSKLAAIVKNWKLHLSEWKWKLKSFKPWFFLFTISFYKVWSNGLVECQGRNIFFCLSVYLFLVLLFLCFFQIRLTHISYLIFSITIWHLLGMQILKWNKWINIIKKYWSF